MTKCKRCGSDLSSNGYCHSCLSYDQFAPSNMDFEQLCNTCNQYFTNYDEYLEHVRSHPICNYCKDRFNSEKELHKHLKTHKCPICHLYFNIVTKHKKQQHSQCNLCKEWFLDKTGHNEHLVEHPQCKYCGKRFSTQVDLANHIDSVHKCNICYGYFTNVQLHMKNTHPSLSDYILNKYSLGSPKKNSSKNIKCLYCDKLFTTESGRNQHIRDVHPNEPIPKPSIKNSKSRDEILSFRIGSNIKTRNECDGERKKPEAVIEYNRTSKKAETENEYPENLTCEYCGMKCTSQTAIEEHLRLWKHRIHRI